MPQQAPDWLGTALAGVRPGHAGLVAARLGAKELLGPSGFKLRSAAFAEGEALDPSFTAEEEDSVAPPLEWSAPPAGTQELVLIVEDPDAPSAEPFCHWLVWGLAPQQGQLLEGETPPRVGKNAFGNSEWLLPDPPRGAAHDYVFQLFAVDRPLSQMPGATRAELVEAIEGHVVGIALLKATFSRSDEDEEVWEEDEQG